MVRVLALSAALAIALPAAVNAHGAMLVPLPEFKDVSNRNAPTALIPGTSGPWTGSDVLRDMADGAGSTCGGTVDGSPQPIPGDGKITFDISAQHIGPCEIWLGDEKVVSENDCWTAFPDHTIPVDFSKCGGGCQLRWLWLATHNNPLEMFDNCVQLGSGGGAPAPAATPAPDAGGAAETQAPPAATPAPVTAAPVTPDAQAPGTVNPGGCVSGIEARFDQWCIDNCAAGFCPPETCKTC